MSPAIAKIVDDEIPESQYQKGVKLLFEKGINRVPKKYILPVEERPNNIPIPASVAIKNVKLPLIDFAELQGPNRSQVLKSLNNACKQYGFFQVVNHGIPSDVIGNMRNVCSRFFELPYQERSKYMSSDMTAPVRYGTSFNQNKDSVFSWRDFLKLMCHPLSEIINYWPSSPSDLRQFVSDYAKETKNLFLMLMEAVLDSLLQGTDGTESSKTGDKREIMKEFGDGSQLMVVNCYPPCPEPELTLGMPPHSDYGFLTLVLQDDVKGLQIQHQGKWFTVEPLPNSFVVNVGDHLEIFSNGRYKSILHRVLVNSEKNRISVATLHSLPIKRTISPWTEIVDETNPKRYNDTDFASFLDHVTSCEPKQKNFLESRKILL